jgi:hypothetical protein
MIKLSSIKPNDGNPRLIKDTRFDKLKASISEFPAMMELRPIIVDADNVILGGNMRYRALKALNYKEVPDEWVKRAEQLTEEEKRRFIISDNVGFGEWDWDILANDWDALELEDFGVELPFIDADKTSEKDAAQSFIDPTINNKWVPDCLYPANNLYDIPTLLPDMQAKEVALPFIPYGAEARTAKGVATYHFYVDDYRFENIWNQPNDLIKDSLIAIVEPNLSLYDTTPISYGLHLIYKKRWIARYLQGKGIHVYADLNVSPKFAEYNVLGLPDRWNAFFTRGYAQRIEYLNDEYAIAKKVSGLAEPNFVVYAGGQLVKRWCAEHNVLYIEQMRGFDKMKEHKSI